MKNSRLKILIAFGILHFAFCLCRCHADLQATVSPGYTFGANERPTTATLNRLGNPTITISGTLGGTNAGLAAGSVTGTMLSDGLPDGVSLTWTNSGPRALQIKAGGVNILELNAAVAGLGLGGGGGAALSNKVDGVTIAITNDVLTLNTNLPIGYMNVTSNRIVLGGTNDAAYSAQMPTNWSVVNGTITVGSSGYVTYTSNIVAGLMINVAHGLGTTPRLVRAVLVCETADEGYVPGDEIDAASLIANTLPNFGIGANATNVFLTCVYATASPVYMLRKNGVYVNTWNPASWKGKIYASP